MKKNRLFTTICLTTAILFTACTQDELAEQGNTLPDGEYPLQIGSVSITAEASEEPWTRIIEKPDGSGSVFQGGERIGVRIAGSEETGIYIIKVDEAGNVTVEPDKPVYWKNTQPAEVTAWYPAEASSVNLEFQYLNGLTYVLHGTGTGSYQSPVTLKFEHQLAKVRVVAKGTAEVRDISIWNVPRICYIDEGKITGLDNIFIGDIQMLPVEREGIGTCWEASVGPGMEIKAFHITVPVDGMSGTYYGEWGSTVTPEAGKLSTITLAVHRKDTKTIDLSNGDYTINGGGTYYFSGTASHAIRVTGGSPNIYLEDAEISVSVGNAIDITGGSPTIHVMGEGNSVSSSYGAGIYVAENSTVTITGRDRNDVLTARTGADGAGIGGYGENSADYNPCGNITINHVTVYAYSAKSSTSSPGIGSHESCGTITIDNATVYARGTGSPMDGCPAIGSYASVPTIVISGSDIYAYRGAYTNGTSYADWIGRGGGVLDYQGGAIQGDIRSTTVYKGKWTDSSEVSEGTVVYGADGVGTEQSQ